MDTLMDITQLKMENWLFLTERIADCQVPLPMAFDENAIYEVLVAKFEPLEVVLDHLDQWPNVAKNEFIASSLEDVVKLYEQCHNLSNGNDSGSLYRMHYVPKCSQVPFSD